MTECIMSLYRFGRVLGSRLGFRQLEALECLGKRLELLLSVLDILVSGVSGLFLCFWDINEHKRDTYCLCSIGSRYADTSGSVEGFDLADMPLAWSTLNSREMICAWETACC